MTEEPLIHARIYGWIADLFLDFMRSRRKSMSVRHACHLAADGFIPAVSAWRCSHVKCHFAALREIGSIQKYILAIYIDFPLRLCAVSRSSSSGRGGKLRKVRGRVKIYGLCNFRRFAIISSFGCIGRICVPFPGGLNAVSTKYFESLFVGSNWGLVGLATKWIVYVYRSRVCVP